jgi:hypothetical protein
MIAQELEKEKKKSLKETIKIGLQIYLFFSFVFEAIHFLKIGGLDSPVGLSLFKLILYSVLYTLTRDYDLLTVMSNIKARLEEVYEAQIQALQAFQAIQNQRFIQRNQNDSD